MYIVERNPRKENQNLVENPIVLQIVVAVETVVVLETHPKSSGKGKKVPLPNDICWRCGKGRHQKGQPCKALDAVCRNCSIKGHCEKVCMKGKHSTHLVNVPEASNSSTSDPDYYNEHGNPVYANIVNVQENKCKHLIQFPISIKLEKVRNSVESSTSKCPTVLLKADTGADVNLMNSRTFDTLFNDRTILQPSSLRMEAYGNSVVEVVGKFHTFLRWKGRVYRQLFYVRSVNNSPSLLLRDGCSNLGMIKPCYSVELTGNSSKFQGNPEAVPTQPITASEKAKLHVGLSVHCGNEGTEMVKWTDSKKTSIKKDETQGAPLMKVRVLDVYSDVFTGIGTSPSAPYKFQLKPNAKPMRHAPQKVPILLQEAFHKEIRNLEQLGILQPFKEVTEWVNSFVIMEKKVLLDSSNTHSPGYLVQKKLWICLDPRDLNEAIEREPYNTWSIEEILGKFHNMKWFTIADFNKGYWMVELHLDSRKLMTIALDIGRLPWTQLPMGSIIAQDVFQRKVDSIFLDMPGVTGIADDMIIYRGDVQEHDGNLLNFWKFVGTIP